jgi:hypothetical protein
VRGVSLIDVELRRVGQTYSAALRRRWFAIPRVGEMVWLRHEGQDWLGKVMLVEWFEPVEGAPAVARVVVE